MEEEKSNNRRCLPPAGPAPWLVYTHGNHRSKKMQTFCTLSSSPPYTKYYFKSIPQLRGKSIISSNDGWLLLHDVDNLKILTLWNPISLQLINLPSLNALDDGVRISSALVCPPHEDDNGCGDVNVFLFAYGVAFSYFPCRDKSSWITQNIELLGQRSEVCRIIYSNGVIYGHASVRSEGGGWRSYLVIIEVNHHGSDFDRPTLTIRSLEVQNPDPEFRYVFSRDYLLASCGHVYFIGIRSRNGTDKRIGAVIIWELDLCLMKWVRVKCLGGRAFFVGPRCCTWCWGSTDVNESGGVRQNSVYFEVSSCEDLGMREALYSYNLEDESLTSFLPCPNLPSPWYTPTWVMPRYQRLARDEVNKHCMEKAGLLKQGSGPTQCTQFQELQEQNEEYTQQSKISESLNAISLTLDKQRRNDVLDKFSLCELILDLIAFVAKRMHLFDYMNFRATCKELRSIAPVAGWRTNNTYPLLMFFASEEPLCRLMDPCRSDTRDMVLPECYGCVVHIDFSRDGWLLLRTEEGKSLDFFNPFTSEGGYLPYIECPGEVSSIGFSSCPTSSDCVTVGLVPWVGCIRIFYHHIGEEIWHDCNFAYHDGHGFEAVVVSSPVYHKGAFHFLDRRGYLGVFQLVNEQGVWDVYDKPQTPSENTFHSSHLVECGGELLSVFIGNMGKWVRVFRLDHMKMKWVRAKSLGNHVLFVGPSSSFSMVAKEREMANRIYLPRLRGNGILYYALDTGKYSTHTGQEYFEDFFGTKEHARCCWI